MDIEILFETDSERNISMVIAPNGGGKTEMLFSFWWVLYDFDFKKLKGKDYTPYSLNSTLYQELANGKPGENQTCFVELSFEENNYTYKVTRNETFTKTSSGISQTQTCTLESKNNSTGETHTLLKDSNKIQDYISRIIPKNILGGIIFDGERMKQLSQVDDDARKAVEGVIRQITNEELFESCRLDLETIQKENSRKIQDYTKKRGTDDISEIEQKISKYSTTLNADNHKIEVIREEIDKIETKLEEVHNALSSLEDSRIYEQKRLFYKAQLDESIKSLSNYEDKLFKDLYQGSSLLLGKIIDEVKNNIENVDIPSGLNVSAVKSILQRSHCICGNPMTAHMKEILKDLIKNLPPDNINSTLLEMGRQMKIFISEEKEVLRSTYTELADKEANINELKDNIANISSLITEGASTQAKELERDYQNLERRMGEKEGRINELLLDIETCNVQLDRLKKLREQASFGDKELSRLNKRDAFIVKCINAIKEIHEANKRESLRQINKRLSEIYSELSEDTGRNLYITQFGESRKKYRLVTYQKESFIKRRTKHYNSSKIHQWEVLGKSDEEIKEMIINEIAQSSSTGQSKINSLAFAKAILEYSSLQRDNKSTEISKSYPFFIDSPFTELSNENLRKSAEKIHTFADQIILLISEESLKGIKDLISPFVKSTTELQKNESENFSSLKC